MKEGRTVNELTEELQRQDRVKLDYASPAPMLSLRHDGLHVGGDLVFGVKPLAHEHIASRLDIPKPYYQRMLVDSPDLLQQNVNHWFTRLEDKKYMVRTLDGDVRALMSNAYRPLDNWDLWNVVAPALVKAGLTVRSCEITETKMIVKAISAEREVKLAKVGDVIRQGLAISNSEVGEGGLQLNPFSEVLRCTNGMVHNELAIYQTHLGKRNNTDGVKEWFKDETRMQRDRAFWMEVRDTVEHFFSKVGFDAIVAQLQAAYENKVAEKDAIGVVQVMSKDFGWHDDESEAIMRHLLTGGDLSQYGVAQAVTRHSADVDDYLRATKLERHGGEIIELPRQDWTRINERAQLN